MSRGPRLARAPSRADPRRRCRVAAWNCRMAVDRKRAMFDRLAADLIVVPECGKTPRFAEELGVSFHWRGTASSKGLGVFALNGWGLIPVPERSPLPWVLPLGVVDPAGDRVALLLALWTVARPGVPSYGGQVTAAIAAWADEIRTGRVILAGDFNCTARPASGTRRPDGFAELARLGAASAYHRHLGCAHGEEEAQTLRWVAPGSQERWYHCDFVFLSPALIPALRHAEVGSPSEWIGPGRSDHCPVIADLALGGLERRAAEA